MLVIEQQREQREHKAIVHLRCEELMLVGTKLGFFPNINLFERLDSERCHSKSAIERIYTTHIQSIESNNAVQCEARSNAASNSLLRLATW